MAGSRKRPSRLGKGLSSLMAQSVPASPPANSRAETADRSRSSEGKASANAEEAAEAKRQPEPTAGGAAAGVLATENPEAGTSADDSTRRAGDRKATDKRAADASAEGAGEDDRSAAPAAGTAPAAPSAPSSPVAPAATAGSDTTLDAPNGTPDASGAPDGGEGLRYISIQSLRPNPHQPRQHFDESALRRLADSIQADGLMQPIVVRPADSGGERGSDNSDVPAFEIVAGERRWRAAALAELERVPAIVRDLDEQALAEWALIENLQREDLNPIERAEAFQGLAQRFGLGHDEIAGRVGLERSTISNLLRLLQLSDFVQGCVREGTLTMGQARAIAGVADAEAQRRLAERAIRQGLSVRQVEQLARHAGDGSSGGATANGESGEPTRNQVRSAYLADLEQRLAEQLQSRVKVRPGRKKGSGTLTIEFYTLDQFDALMEKLGVNAGA